MANETRAPRSIWRCVLGIAERVLFRWKQELTVTAPAFISVEIGAIEIDRRRRVWSTFQRRLNTALCTNLHL